MGAAAENLAVDGYKVVSLEEQVRLRDLPALFTQLEEALEFGAHTIDLHIGRTRHMTRAAYSVLEGAIRRFAERGVTVQMVAGVFAIR